MDIPVQYSLVDLRSYDGQDLVRLQGQPAHGEYHHDEHEHLDGLLLVAQDAVVAPLVLLAGHAVPPKDLGKKRETIEKVGQARDRPLPLKEDRDGNQLPDGYKLAHQSDPDVGVADEAQGQEVLHEVQGEDIPARERIYFLINNAKERTALVLDPPLT